jgi:hypothetical protein
MSLFACGCTHTKQFAEAGFLPPRGDYSLVVMRPDVTVGQLTAGGLVEPRENWTDQARENLLAALVDQQRNRGGRTLVVQRLSDAGADLALVRDLEELHNAVGRSIQIHKYVSGQNLPTKEGKFDWSLGEKAVQYGNASGYDYALFLHAEDSFSSSGRVALKILGMAGCIIGACVLVPGKTRLAFASLVDLKTGRIVWYNVVESSIGDMRTREGAASTIHSLLDKMKPGKPTPATREN